MRLREANGMLSQLSSAVVMAPTELVFCTRADGTRVVATTEELVPDEEETA